CLVASPALAEDAAALRTQVQEATNLDDAQRSSLLAALDAAQADQAATTQRRAETESLRTAAAGSAAELRRLERELGRDDSAEVERARQRIESLDEVEALEQELQTLKSRLDPLRRELQVVTASLASTEVSGGVSLIRLQEN